MSGFSQIFDDEFHLSRREVFRPWVVVGGGKCRLQGLAVGNPACKM